MIQRLLRRSTRRFAPPSPLIPVQVEGSKPPFFFVHGGKASQLRLSKHLGAEQTFYGLAQHFDGQPIHYTSIPDIAAFYCDALKSVQPAGPYFLGGHSLGGIIAFEMAQRLRQSGQDVALLVLVDSGSRQIGVFDPRRRHRSPFTWQSWIRHLGSQFRSGLRDVRKAAVHLPKTLACHGYHGLGRPLPRRLVPFYINQIVFEGTYFKSLAHYVPQKYPGKIVYLKSEEPGDRDNLWRQLAMGGVEVRRVSGQHLSMLKEPHLLRLADTLRECLVEAQSGRVNR